MGPTAFVGRSAIRHMVPVITITVCMDPEQPETLRMAQSNQSLHPHNVENF